MNIAGAKWFGDGTHQGLRNATCKEELVPNLVIAGEALTALSNNQGLFLSAMVSFYNSAAGAIMLERYGFTGLADFGRLDVERREVIADLMLNYPGW